MMLPSSFRARAYSIVRCVAVISSLATLALPELARCVPVDEASPLRPGYDRCLEKTRGVTVEMNSCIGIEFDFQDQRLNAAYKALRQSLSEAERIKLRDEEREWIKEKNTSCAPPADGGTADMLGANECRLTRTAVRAAELEARIVRH